MKKSVLGIALLLSLGVSMGQNRPLITETPTTVGKNRIRTELGFEFLQEAVYTFSGLEGDLSRIGVLGVRMGVGSNVELQFFWTAQNFLNINRRWDAPNTPNLDFSGNSTSDVGDLVIASKFQFADEKRIRPAIGFQFAAELPNASNQSGLGNDEMNFYAAILFEKNFGKLGVIGNAGLAILGDPVTPGAQDDLFTYGLAANYTASEMLSLLIDFYGRAGDGGFGTDQHSIIRAGVRIHAAGVFWDVAFLAGLLDTDPSTGIIFGLSKDFSVRLFAR
jgi:hypothetical protein